MKKIFFFFVVLLVVVPALADGQSRIQVIPEEAPPVATYYRSHSDNRQPSVKLYGLGVNVLTQDGGQSFGFDLGRNEYAAMSGVLRTASTRLMQPEMDMSLRGWLGVNSSAAAISAQLMDKGGFPESWEVPTRAIVFTVVGAYGEESEFSEASGVTEGILSRFLRKLGIKSPLRVYHDRSDRVAHVFITDVSVVDVKTGKFIYPGFQFTPVEGFFSKTARTRYEAEYKHYGVRSGTDRDVSPDRTFAIAADDAVRRLQPQLERLKQYLLSH